ncbi:MAG: hypothetical protein QOH24_1074 [Verrucomicrobiota bacterium]|jgi:hypothetical protein
MWNKSKSHDPLSILRMCDHFRHWGTLDDERVCVVCGRAFHGHEVRIVRTGDEYKLHCPTRDCESGVHHWVYTGNPLISDTAYADWWRALSSANDASLEMAETLLHR